MCAGDLVEEMPVKILSAIAASFLALVATSSSAFAIDCAKAAGPVEKLICDDGALREADDALNAAYKAASETASDDEIRAALVESQKRWLAARDKTLAELIANPEQGEGKTPREIAAEIIHARTGWLGVDASGDEKTLIENAEQQRKFAAQFSGGPYAGFNTSCEMLPPDQAYGCFSTRSYQNGDRVCTIEEYWATGSVYVQRFVADVVDGKPKLVASCSFNGNDNACPGSIDENARWNVTPNDNPSLYAAQSLPKLDVDVTDSGEEKWLTTCLTDKSFPTADPTASGE